MGILKKIERIDKEDFDQFLECYIGFKTGSTTREAIFDNLLFKSPKGINAYNWDPSITIKSLFPLYTTTYQRIYPSQCRSVNDFKKVYGFSPEAIAILSEKKRIIPVFDGKISEYLGLYLWVGRLGLEKEGTKRKKPRFKKSEMHGDCPTNFREV